MQLKEIPLYYNFIFREYNSFSHNIYQIYKENFLFKKYNKILNNKIPN